MFVRNNNFVSNKIIQLTTVCIWHYDKPLRGTRSRILAISCGTRRHGRDDDALHCFAVGTSVSTATTKGGGGGGGDGNGSGSQKLLGIQIREPCDRLSKVQLASYFSLSLSFSLSLFVSFSRYTHVWRHESARTIEANLIDRHVTGPLLTAWPCSRSNSFFLPLPLPLFCYSASSFFPRHGSVAKRKSHEKIEVLFTTFIRYLLRQYFFFSLSLSFSLFLSLACLLAGLFIQAFSGQIAASPIEHADGSCLVTCSRRLVSFTIHQSYYICHVRERIV